MKIKKIIRGKHSHDRPIKTRMIEQTVFKPDYHCKTRNGAESFQRKFTGRKPVLNVIGRRKGHGVLFIITNFFMLKIRKYDESQDNL